MKMPYQRPLPAPRAAGQEVSLRAELRSEDPEPPSTPWVHKRAPGACPLSPLSILFTSLSPRGSGTGTAVGERPLHPHTNKGLLVTDVLSVQPPPARGGGVGALAGEQHLPKTPLAKPPLLRGVLCILCSCVYGSKMYNISLLFVADNDFIFITCTPCSPHPLHTWEGRLGATALGFGPLQRWGPFQSHQYFCPRVFLQCWICQEEDLGLERPRELPAGSRGELCRGKTGYRGLVGCWHVPLRALRDSPGRNDPGSSTGRPRRSPALRTRPPGPRRPPRRLLLNQTSCECFNGLFNSRGQALSAPRAGCGRA
ncbi:uncharacterized protein LOC113488924 [Athene cunicularia]|uniref:uncharacterized protein LOC113488924 n=1 Tax=Athene cunicularia TaxID=194338 RepID=UPI000EF6C359|nr:uncharacterized protein LOC113488924 [Athene cunicularia]